jgi:L-alanine-DL-glutamate epimerase-like enolase superfamily enzyme
VAVVPNLLMLEVNQVQDPFKTEIFKDPLVVKRGYVDLPGRPGFGVEVIPDAEQESPFIPAPPRG